MVWFSSNHDDLILLTNPARMYVGSAQLSFTVSARGLKSKLASKPFHPFISNETKIKNWFMVKKVNNLATNILTFYKGGMLLVTLTTTSKTCLLAGQSLSFGGK